MKKSVTKFIHNFLSQNLSIPSNQNMSQEAKCFNTPILYTTNALLQLFSKHQIYFFSHLPARKYSTIFQDGTLLGLILHFSFFKCFQFFKFNMPSQKSDDNNDSIRIIFLKTSINKTDIINKYTKNAHFITRKCDITRIFIKL